MSLRRTDVILPLALFVTALVLRLALISPSGFDGLYGQDAYAYYDFAGDLGDAIHNHDAPPPFFWSLGYPALLLTGFTLGGESPYVAQAISILMGAALATLVYVLARLLGVTLFGALVAGMLMVVCGQAVQSSVVIMADIPALFWATLSAICLLIWQQHDLRRWLILAAILLTFAILSRWIYLILAPLWVVIVLFHWRGRIRVVDSAVVLLIVALLFLPQVAFSLHNPYPTLNHAWVQGWSLSNALEKTFVNIDGQFHYAQINAIYYAQIFYKAHYLAPIFTAFIALGLWTLWRKKRYIPAILLIGWTLLPYVFLIGIPLQNIRFPLIVMPTVFVLVGMGMDKGAKWILNLSKGDLSGLPYRASWITYGLLVCPVVFGIITMQNHTRMLVDTFINNQQRDKNVAEWAEALLPNNAHVYTFDLTLTLQHYTPFEVSEIYYETPQTLADNWQHGRTDYLLINVWQIEHQWDGREPQIAYHWLRDERGLSFIERYGNYTLFRVAG